MEVLHRCRYGGSATIKRILLDGCQTHVEDGKFRQDQRETFIECFLGEFDLAHVAVNREKMRFSHMSTPSAIKQ